MSQRRRIFLNHLEYTYVHMEISLDKVFIILLHIHICFLTSLFAYPNTFMMYRAYTYICLLRASENDYRFYQFPREESTLTLIRNDDHETSGDDRRASVSKKPRPRRASTTASRKDSVRPVKADVKETPIVTKDARELEQARRHRRIAMIVLGTFIFLLTASVLVVVITLTHSSFLSPATGSKELAEHRAQCKRHFCKSRCQP